MIILVDFDGVINKAAYFSVQYEIDFGISQNEITQFFIKDFESCARGESRIEDKLKPYLKTWKWEKEVDELLDYWFENDVKLDEKLIDFIANQNVKELEWILVSQQEINRKNYIWERCGLKNIFKRFYCTCEIGYLKNEEKFYEYVINDLFENGEIKNTNELRFIDDTIEFVKAARKFKIKSILFKDNSTFFDLIDSI